MGARGQLGRGAVARGGRLGQARGDQRQGARGESTCLGSSSAGQPPSLHAPTSTDDVKCCRPAMSVMWRVTSAKRCSGQSPRVSGSVLDRLVGALKWDKGIAPPLDTPHTPPQRKRLARPRSSRSGARALRKERRALTSRRGSASPTNIPYKRPSPL